MRNKWCVLAVAATALGMMASSGMADLYVGNVVLTQGSYSSGYGGEFTGSVTSAASPIPPADVRTFDPGIISGSLASQQSSLVGGSSTFQTFCIQEGLNDVVYYPGNTYYGILTNQIPAGPHTVTDATKVLFDDFSTGRLPGYNYGNTGTGLSRQACAGALQAAIWVAEGDQNPVTGNAVKNAEADAGISGNAAAILQADAWYDEAEAYVNRPHTVIPQDISILEMYGTDNGNNSLHPAQAQLVRTGSSPFTSSPLPVPLPASAGMGFSMLAGIGALAICRKQLGRREQIA